MTIRMNWGTGIAATYTIFALATSGFVAFAMGRHVDLVSPDYYARSLQLDRRQQAERNAAALQGSLSIEQRDGRSIDIALPASQAGRASGTITLYRASDARADRQFGLSLDGAGRQRLDLTGLMSGHWLVQIEWAADGVDYYAQRAVVVP
jgi:hypothetical protein